MREIFENQQEITTGTVIFVLLSSVFVLNMKGKRSDLNVVGAAVSYYCRCCLSLIDCLCLLVSVSRLLSTLTGRQPIVMRLGSGVVFLCEQRARLPWDPVLRV